MRVSKIILLAILISGCSVKQTDKNTIRIRLREDPTTLDPAYIVDVAGGSVSAKLYKGLVKIDPSGEIIPDIAKSWHISKDGLIYTFKLNRDADAIKKYFERVIAESPRKWIFDKVKEFVVTDKNTLRIKLKQPFSPFLSMLTMPNAYIGLGPYKLISWNHDEKIIIKRNSDNLIIEYQIIPEEFTARTEFDLGNLDIMEVSPIQWKAVLKDKKNKAKQFSQVGLNIYYIGFNCRKPLFQNIKFRQALNYAIDRKAIINSIMCGQAIPAWGPIPPGLFKNKGKYKYAYLPNKAKKLLGGKYGMPENPIRLYVRAQAQAIQIAEVMQYYLDKIGIRVIITPLEWSAFKKAIDDGSADLFLMSWWADYPDSENFLFPTFHSGNFGAGGNRSYFKNKKINKLIEQAQREIDPVKRDKLNSDLQRIISRQAPWIFLWNANELFVTQPWIDGFKLYPIYNGDKGENFKLQNPNIKTNPKSKISND